MQYLFLISQQRGLRNVWEIYGTFRATFQKKAEVYVIFTNYHILWHFINLVNSYLPISSLGKCFLKNSYDSDTVVNIKLFATNLPSIIMMSFFPEAWTLINIKTPIKLMTAFIKLFDTFRRNWLLSSSSICIYFLSELQEVLTFCLHPLAPLSPLFQSLSPRFV